MEAFGAYQMFVALQQHFTGNFDYFRYLGHTNTTIESFQRRKDKFNFHKLVENILTTLNLFMLLILFMVMLNGLGT